ncbi:MAG: ROK family protein [Bacteroidales bacterium]|mgnify:FL=1|jgi:glucokinase|nr:ROK family protein [Bacteroidales bacterium]
MKKPYAIGIDIGGTNTVFGIVDTHGKVVSKSSVQTNQYPTPELIIDDIKKKLDPLIEDVGGISNIKGIGIGAPNGNHYTGNIEYAPNLQWKGVVPLSKLMSDKFGIPAVITNDANAAAIGEMIYGAARGMKNFIMITLGTGVGSGIVIDGKLVYGHDGFAGELGHVCSVRDGRSCGCGRLGCLEAYASANGVARTAKEILENQTVDSLLRNIPIESITSKDVFDAASKGDVVALEIFEFTGKILGEAIADFVAFSAPEAIILFGGLTKSGDYIMKPIVDHMEKNLLKIWQGKIKVLFSDLNEADAAVLGASALVWEL